MFLGYSDPAIDADAWLPGCWFLSGDIGRLDAAGLLAITDRKKDIIIRGGENISSREVEDLLLRIPGVREAAAVGYPDDRLGERSDEHTSELQSLMRLSYAVFCLQKKKKTQLATKTNE